MANNLPTPINSGLTGSGSEYFTPKGSGMDPATGMMLASLASSLFGGLFGGSDGPQERKAFSGSVSPQNTLQEFMGAVKGMGSSLGQRQPTQLRSTVPGGGRMQPVRIPGLDIQIGGGLGMDPAMKDPSMLMGQQSPMGDPFGAMTGMTAKAGQRGSRSPNSSTAKTRLREPEQGGF